jgi:uridine kinase
MSKAISRGMMIDRLAGLFDALRRRHPVRVAIDGPDAAGKTMVADDLGSALRSRDVW